MAKNDGYLTPTIQHNVQGHVPMDFTEEQYDVVREVAALAAQAGYEDGRTVALIDAAERARIRGTQ